MGVRSGNSALKFYVSGQRAKDLEGLTDLAGRVLQTYDTAVMRATIGLKRRALPMVSRAVRGQYNIKAGTLSGRYRAEEYVRGKRNGGDGLISIWASTRKIPLLEFSGRWSGRRSQGASAEIERGQRKTYDSAFIATIRGRRAIRVRGFNRDTQRRHGRGPVRMLYGPSPFEMLSGLDHRGSRAARDEVLSELTVFYTAELRRQFRLGRRA